MNKQITRLPRPDANGPRFPHPHPPRLRIPCEALRALYGPTDTGGAQILAYRLLPDNLPNGSPRQTRFIGSAVARTGNGVFSTICVVRIGGIACLEIDLSGWPDCPTPGRWPVEFSDAELANLLRQIERRHSALMAQRYARGLGRN